MATQGRAGAKALGEMEAFLGTEDERTAGLQQSDHQPRPHAPGCHAQMGSTGWWAFHAP